MGFHTNLAEIAFSSLYAEIAFSSLQEFTQFLEIFPADNFPVSLIIFRLDIF